MVTEPSMHRARNTFAAAQRAVLEAIAFGRAQSEVLRMIVELIEAQSPDMMCSIILIDEEGRIHHAAAPHLPREYIDSIEGAKIGPQAGSCGTAAYTGKPVIVADIATHPAWIKYRDFALPHGLRACWSTPIIAPDGKVLATFAMYYREIREPTAEEMEWIEVATHLAYVALISERARASEVEVRRGETLRAVILDSVDDAIFYIDVEGEGLYRFAWVNKAFTELFGVPPAEMVGRFLHELLPEEIRAATLERYATAARTHQRQSWELLMQARTGEKYGEIILIPLFDANGRCTNFVGTIHDLTARIEAEKERVSLQARLEQGQRMQSLGTLAGGIAHDFNNILAAIGGNTDLLLDEVPGDWSSRSYLLEIKKASVRASELVRQILAFSRSSTPNHEVFDTRIVTDEALQLLRATLPPNIETRKRYASDAPGIKGDSTQFHQIVINLVTNAAHAYDAGGVVEVSLQRVTNLEVERTSGIHLKPGEYLQLRVTDQGRGMDADTLKRAFDPFFTTRAHGEGTGLGLSVVHGIVESHGGSIDIASVSGSGTSVLVHLPAAQLDDNRKDLKICPRGCGEHIMYVDDEEALVALMKIALTKRGYQVSGYTDPAVALQEFSKQPHQFRAVITDVAMPRMSGPQLAAKLREIRSDVPIILTSGYIREEDRQAAQELQIDQLVYKSNTIEELAEGLANEIAMHARNQRQG